VIKQCFLSRKDMSDNNGEGEVYGLVTTGKGWQMLKYDGVSFKMVILLTIGKDKNS